MNNTKAFTLIELLVVVLIIGILAAVALPQYRKAVVKSHYATIKNLLTNIAQAQETYYLANGRYATDFDELDIGMPSGKIETSSNSAGYKYDWGLVVCTSIGCYIRYQGNGVSLQYGFYYPHWEDERAGIRYCISEGNSNLSSLGAQICQTETGKKEADATSQGNWLEYRY